MSCSVASVIVAAATVVALVALRIIRQALVRSDSSLSAPFVRELVRLVTSSLPSHSSLPLYSAVDNSSEV